MLLLIASVIIAPALLCGVEWCDAGFYMTFYDNVFSHPEAVSYNFMYYLSGLIGGLALKIWNSVLCVRILGMIFTLGSVWIMWYMTRRDRITTPQFLAVIMISAGALSTPLAFYNDILTVFLALVSLALIAEFISRVETEVNLRFPGLLFFSGFVAGINTFSRMPNILEVFFIFILPIFGRDKRCKCMAVWATGWISGLAVGILIIIISGHIDPFMSMLRDLLALSKETGQEGTHGLGSLIAAQWYAWRAIGVAAIKLFVVGFIGSRLVNNIKRGIFKNVVELFIFAIILFLMLRSDYITALAALALSGILLIFVEPGCRSLKPLLRVPAVCALFMLAVLPLGSDYGIYNAGSIMLWLALPLGLVPFCKLSKPLTVIVGLILAGMAIGSFYQGGAYFDNTPIYRMSEVHTSNRMADARLKGLYTSPERCERVKEIVDSVSAEVLPGDTLMVYGSAPMLNYLTSTIPAYGISWPELLTADMLRSRLNFESAPPYIAIYKFPTIGAIWESPSKEFVKGEKYTNRYHTAAKSKVMENFLEINNYRLIMDGDDFALYKRP